MKSLSREAIQRMTGGASGASGSGSAGGGTVDLTGYATEIWTEEHYINKEFFSSLFKAYDANGNEVLPNDTETVVSSIKAMFGFWTDFYISALGTGGHQSVDLRLAQLADVNVAGVTNGQVLTYDSTSGKWIASTPQSGTDMATVWANLAASGNQQIDVSHLSTALTGYATQTWVGQQGYITSSAISDMATKTWVNSQISDMATKTWVGQNYLSKTDAASTYLSIAFFNRLFKAYNGTTQVNPNNTTTAIDNIKAMFGFWTDFYISALGTGGQQSVDLRLAQLSDVNVAGVTNGQVLTYNSTTGKWVASTPQSGTDMATVWANLAANGNQQINASHLTTALNGYATQTWVTNQGYITASAISDMATKTWVNSQISDMATKTWVGLNYLKLIGGTLTGTLNGVNWYGTSEVNNNWALWQKATNTNSHSAFCAAHSGGYGMWVGVSTDDDAHYIANFCNGTTAATSGGNSCLMIRADGRVIIGRGFLDITNNSRTVTIGAQNNGAIHIYNDNNSPTFVNGSLSSNANGSYDLGTTNYYWNVVYANRIIAKSGDTILCQSSGNCGIGTSSPNYKLEVNGTLGVSDDVTIANDKHIYFKDSGGTARAVLQFSDNNNINLGYGTAPQGYNTYINGNIVSLRYGTSRTSGLYLNASGNIGIGTTSPSHKLHVDGGIYSTSYVTALSDARHKDVIGDTGLTVEQIAEAPAIRFQWNDRDDKTVFAGSIAQYWQKVLPEVVQSQADDTLSLDYQVAALISSITVARKVMNHESRLQRLEKMFAINEDDIED